jgi:nicotinamidase-related amidase
MAVTTLDGKCALLVVDLQNAIVALSTAHPADGVVDRAGDLATAFRDRGLPVELITAAGQAPGRIERQIRVTMTGPMPEQPMAVAAGVHQQPSDHLVTKRTRSAFTNTGLAEHLRSLGVTQVVVAGIATSIAVESTARDAYEQGFNVTFALDAMTDLTLEAHEHSTTQIFPGLGETGSTDEIITLLERHHVSK